MHAIDGPGVVLRPHAHPLPPARRDCPTPHPGAEAWQTQLPPSGERATPFERSAVGHRGRRARLGLSFQTNVRWRDSRLFPTRAIQFLQTHPQQGRMFNQYAWGGYYIWSGLFHRLRRLSTAAATSLSTMVP